MAQAFNSNAMVYQPQPFKSETYNYSRWRVNPGYLVTDYLLRDLRDSRLFKAVFGPDSSGKYRFRLEGGVEEFQELDEPGGWKASLGLTVTLLDTSQEELPQRVVFQKNYRVLEPMPEKTPEGLARAMSRAMEQASAQIMTDIYEAARRRTPANSPLHPLVRSSCAGRDETARRALAFQLLRPSLPPPKAPFIMQIKSITI